MAATGEPEVFAGDANPLEVLGCGEHLLDQLAVRVLDLLSLHQSATGVGNAIGEPVPNRLQLTEVEHPRSGSDGLDAVRNLRMAKTLADEFGELRLEPADLLAQLQPCLALVNRDVQPVESPLFQQSRHLQKV